MSEPLPSYLLLAGSARHECKLLTTWELDS